MNFKQNNIFLQKINIVDIVEKYIKLQKKGKNLYGLCPFHKDNKPSLHISENKQIFKCFSCNVGGNAIRFVMLYHNLNWEKAILEISKTFNITFEGFQIQQIQLSVLEKEMLQINKESNFFFQMNLLESSTSSAMKYCQKRKITSQMIKQFQIGWMGNDDFKMLDYFKKKKINKVNLINSQLFKWKNNEQLRCYFQNRLIFPILNENGDLSGFSGRIIFENNVNLESQAKYLNSFESSIFKKNQILYNFFYVTQHFKAINTIYLVEGFLDSIRMIIKKYPAVALMGVVLSAYQINLIKERYQNVIIFPDHDNAGVNCAIKNATLLMKNKINVSIVDHNLQLDPDLCLQKDGFVLENTKKVHPIDFLINKQIKLVNNETTKIFFTKIKFFFPYLGPVERFQFIEKISLKFQIPLEIINQELKNWQNSQFQQNNFTNQSIKILSKKLIWKELLFVNLLYHPELISKINKINGIFNDDELDHYYVLLLDWNKTINDKKELTFHNFLEFINNFQQKRWLEHLYKKHKDKLEGEELTINIFKDYLKLFFKEKLILEIKELSKKLKTDDIKEKMEILNKIQQITIKKSQI